MQSPFGDIKTPVYRPIIIAKSLAIVEKDGVTASAASFYGIDP